MTDRRLAGTALVVTAGSLAVLWFSGLPLGVPGEWLWLKIAPARADVPEVLLGAVLAAFAAGIYLAIAWLGAKRLPDASRLETFIWLLTLVGAGFTWLWLVQQSPAEQYRLQKAAFVLYYPGSEGYFYEARYKVSDSRSFLAGYEDKMREGDVLHIGTHPPGLFLLHSALIRLTERYPAVTSWANDTQPREVREMFDEIERNTFQTLTPLLPRDRAAIWLAALLTQLLAAATVIPLYLCLREYFAREASWLATSLWPLVPALAIFLPKSDALYPLVGMLCLYCWLQAWRKGSVCFGFSFGLLLCLGLFLSLALIPVAVCAALLMVWETAPPAASSSLSRRSRIIRVLVSALAGVLLPIAVLWFACDVNLPAVWAWNYRNHAAFYDEFDRTYGKWLLVNVLELFYGVGPPVFILMLAGYGRAFRSARSWRDRSIGPYVCFAVVWTLLWISGKNMGEAARLWLFLMPWPIWLSAACFEQAPPQGIAESPASGATGGGPLKVWLPCAALQAIACIATVLCVYGFRNQ